MLQGMKQTIKSVAAIPSFKAYQLVPCRPTLHVLRKTHNIQMTADEMSRIVSAIQAKPKCRLLIFGVGNDSRLWAWINRNGKTVFFEDSREWINIVAARTPGLHILEVKYSTRADEWKTLFDRPDRLTMELPTEVKENEWDVVIVDAPVGWYDESPGRMQSIFMARRLVVPGGDVFVHDCDREIERVYADHFYGSENLVEEVGLLRHYKVKK